MLLSIGMLMLSATQVYTILTVQLFAFLNLLPVEADILAYNFENASQTFEDLPARFGYRLPAEGLKGFLINSKPENACEPIVPPPLKDNSSSTFIVLIRRLDCNFDIKVLNAQRAGYKAAIVHNVDSDDLISMGSNDTIGNASAKVLLLRAEERFVCEGGVQESGYLCHGGNGHFIGAQFSQGEDFSAQRLAGLVVETLKKIDIPSVFIGESSANSLKDEFTYEKGGHVILVPELSLPLEYYLIPFLIIVGICLILIVIFMITKFVQDRHRNRRNRLRKDQLKKLPVHKFKKGDEYDVCAICLEEYEDGDKLRILPCSHVSVRAPSFGSLSASHSHQNMTESSDYEEDDNETDSSDADNEVTEHSVVVQLQPDGEPDNIANTV
ncbi:E3 ubiquitin-protein ligase RNF13 [Microtus ochrogaster]|uniref:RING-type E3 ubiquitin transferase n=1 Tax=Microtus ochrogaster TaxID=79684 RepID=A0A8J6GVH8_MICOH|nr:E3 ubiquitin-protein ligase RNF13 [Microtus ochrogaster]